ncbi:unnamed protein product, partial [Rotaria magnacalcarata]
MNNDSNKSVEQSNSIAADHVQGSFDEDLVTCSICHMILWKPVACKTCENSFCSDCINQWQQKQPNKCPFACRYEKRKCIAAILKETFDSMYSNTLKIKEHGLVVVLIDKREHSEKKILNNQWISFGVLSQSIPMAPKSYDSPSFYDWGQCTTQTFLNGSNQKGYAG